MERKISALVIKPTDSVAVAIDALKAGEVACFKVAGEKRETKLVTDVPIYHKFAMVDIKAGELVYKYGQVIGKATSNIAAGEHIHTHNIVSIREAIER